MLDLHRRTVQRSMDVVAAIRDGQWDNPTPCAQWTLRDLLVHMIRENRGFAAAAAGEISDRSSWTSPVGEDPRTEYAESAEAVIAAFAQGDVLARDFWLPFINDAMMFPGRKAVGFHLLDYLVHGWDAAMGSGQSLVTDDEVVAAVYGIAVRDVPDGPRRVRVGATFAPPVAAGPASGSAPTLADVLVFLGRDPDWT
jgi:uncharacterized protein (TIGR03086 family)